MKSALCSKLPTLIGSALGHGAQITTTREGPEFLFKNFRLSERLSLNGLDFPWTSVVTSDGSQVGLDANVEPVQRAKHYNTVLNHNKKLAEITRQVAENGRLMPVVIGGDHSGAVGTWSGMAQALRVTQKTMGLVWIDAHMDAHTVHTTPSNAYHGMPLAILLGHDESELARLQFPGPKIKPQNLVLIGVRSYEQDEQAFLKKLGIKVFHSEDVFRLGYNEVFARALDFVTRNTDAYGVSLDLDVFDPKFAPGVGSPVPDGLDPLPTLSALQKTLFGSPMLQALEIVEFNPQLDRDNITANVIYEILRHLANSLQTKYQISDVTRRASVA